jgi:two-component system, OmpR family, KDP operon response regulator KdpE
MSKESILIVDDEQSIRRFLRVTLTSENYTIFEAVSGKEAVSLAAKHKPNIIILDLGLPDIDGVEVTRLLRQWTQVPIIILSVRDSEADKVLALDAGADDYLTKPFGVGELLARLRVAIRRAIRPAVEPIFISGDLKVDLTDRVVTIAEKEISLTPTEYALLRVLTINAGKVLTHNFLLREVWGEGYSDESHMLHVNISNLRRKIETEPTRPQHIITESGVGYRLRVD